MGIPSKFRNQRACILALVAVNCIGISGCGSQRPETAVVAGVVTLDGKIVPGATVVFVPGASGGRPARGETDSRGYFQLTTFDDQPDGGALLGVHQVTVTKIEPGSAEPLRGADGLPLPDLRRKIRWLIPERYANALTSGLKATVHAGENDVRLDLTSATKPSPATLP